MILVEGDARIDRVEVQKAPRDRLRMALATGIIVQSESGEAIASAW